MGHVDAGLLLWGTPCAAHLRQMAGGGNADAFFAKMVAEGAPAVATADSHQIFEERLRQVEKEHAALQAVQSECVTSPASPLRAPCPVCHIQTLRLAGYVTTSNGFKY